MKVTTAKPAEIKTPVKLTETRYELYFSRPIMIGVINRVGGLWETADGSRFISSRAALDYLVKLADAKGGILPSPIPEKKIQKPISTVAIPTTPTIILKKKVIASPQKEAYNQNHPEFQKFLEFMNWKTTIIGDN